MKTISLCYRKIITSSSGAPWDKLVFEDSYQEFKMLVQYFNKDKKYQTFAELIRNVPGAEKLHFLVSASVSGYVAQLNNCIPDIADNLGKRFLQFKNFSFEIINSHINNISKHQVAVNFFSEKLLLHEVIGEYLLLSDLEQQENVYETHLLKIVPYLSIDQYQYENVTGQDLVVGKQEFR